MGKKVGGRQRAYKRATVVGRNKRLFRIRRGGLCVSSEEKGGAGEIFHTTQQRAGLNHVGEIWDGKVGRNNRLSFLETMIAPIIELGASDSNGASLCCVRRRAVCSCDKPPVVALFCDNRLFRLGTDSEYCPKKVLRVGQGTRRTWKGEQAIA